MKNNMKQRFAITLVLMLAACMAWAQHDNVRDYITVQMVPNHSDWTYRLGETVEIEFSVRKSYCAVPNMEVSCEWGPELRTPEKTWTQATGNNGIVKLKLAGSKVPGFKTLKAVVEYEGKSYTNTLNLAFAPDEIAPTCKNPQDFDEFWAKAIADARKTPLEPLLTPHPELATPHCDVYEVRFQNHKAGCYMYGMMCVPKGEGKFPVVIEWPGAGVKPHRGMPNFLVEEGVITLEMGVNGIPVNMEQQVYTDLRANALKDYQTIHNESRDDYYYKKVYVGTVRTVDMLCTLPFVDTTRIAVSGGSQGGALSIVHAALDNRVKYVSAAYPALSEIAGYYNGRVGGWPRIYRNPNEVALKEKAAVSEYYDVVNFGRRLHQPLLFFIGYNDQVCCPTSTYSVYNSVPTSDKELFLALDCAHWQYPEHKRLRHEWLLERMK